jgi:hypothetical protein
MMLKLRSILAGAAICALICASATALHAATIIKLNLGNIGPDLSMTPGGLLGTANDNIVATTGNQNTAIEYTSFLDPIPDENFATASFTLSSLSRVGTADLTTQPGFAIQTYNGGSFSLFDTSDTLLLSGSIGTSSLLGTVAPPGAGGVFTIGTVSVTGGVLAGLIDTNSLALSMTLTNVNGGNGFSVDGQGVLNEFQADSSINISGNPSPVGSNFPEPGSFFLATVALLVGSAVRRRAA